MPTRKVFFDGNGNELNCYPNDKGDLYIGVSTGDDDDYGGHITLKKGDVKELIELLQEYESEINED